MKEIKKSNFVTVFIRPVCAVAFTLFGVIAAFTWFSDLEDVTKYIILLFFAFLCACVVGWQIVIDYNKFVSQYNKINKEYNGLENKNKNLNEIIKRKDIELTNIKTNFITFNNYYEALYNDFGEIISISIRNSTPNEREKIEKIYNVYLRHSREFKS